MMLHNPGRLVVVLEMLQLVRVWAVGTSTGRGGHHWARWGSDKCRVAWPRSCRQQHSCMRQHRGV